MTPNPSLRAPLRILPEFILTVLIVASICYVAWFFYWFGYLPQPFLYDTNDTFMDWYNTSYWANNAGAYDVWRSVYPPLSFVFLKIFSIKSCYMTSPFLGRNCDWYGRLALSIFYIANVILIFRCYWAIDRRTALLRGAAMAFGLPMLFALERGNLIVPCFTAFALGHSRLLRQTWARWLNIALTINFKPYLLLAVIPYALQRRWRWLMGCATATVLIYLFSYAIEGAGGLSELYANTINWTNFTGTQLWNEIYYSTSYATLVAFINGQFPILDYVGSWTIEKARLILPITILAGQCAVLACLAGAWMRPGIVPTYRLTALCLVMAMTTASPGGYSEVFLLFLVFMEPWQGSGKIIALIAAYILCISADYVVLPIQHNDSFSWLGGRTVYAEFGVAVGQFLRPGLLLTIEFALAAVSLSAIAKAFRPVRLGGIGEKFSAPPAYGNEAMQKP